MCQPQLRIHRHSDIAQQYPNRRQISVNGSFKTTEKFKILRNRLRSFFELWHVTFYDPWGTRDASVFFLNSVERPTLPPPHQNANFAYLLRFENTIFKTKRK